MKRKFGEQHIDPVVSSFKELNSPSGGFYTVVPQVVQRCLFLEPKSISVLMTLMSYADEKGLCKVNQATIARQVRIKSIKTIDKALDDLVSKRFILKANKIGQANDYKFRDWSNNPYLILSEAIQKVEIEAKKSGVTVKSICKVLDKLIEDESIYTPIVKAIEEGVDSYLIAINSVLSFVNDSLGTKIDISVEKKKSSGKRGLKKGVKAKTTPRNREWNPSSTGEKKGKVRISF